MSTDGYSVGPTTTEWHDALVKHKIIEKPEKKISQDESDTRHMWDIKEAEERLNYHYDGSSHNKSLQDINEMEDDLDEDTLHRLRQRRLQELKAKEVAERFGRIQMISKADYTKEVTEASRQSVVICCLFATSQMESKKMLQCLESLADKFKDCKIVKIRGQECIENYPEDFCPTLIIYKDENPIGHIKGLHCFGGLNVISSDIVEWELAQIGVWKTDLEDNPRTFQLHTKTKTTNSKDSGSKGRVLSNKNKNKDDEEEEEENEENENAGGRKGAQNDSDLSDLDLD
jgi:hypothetical protein